MAPKQRRSKAEQWRLKEEEEKARLLNKQRLQSSLCKKGAGGCREGDAHAVAASAARAENLPAASSSSIAPLEEPSATPSGSPGREPGAVARADSHKDDEDIVAEFFDSKQADSSNKSRRLAWHPSDSSAIMESLSDTEQVHDVAEVAPEHAVVDVEARELPSENRELSQDPWQVK